MQAGLANRMFQYTYWLYLQKKGYDVYVDNSFKTSKWKIDEVYWEEIFPNAKLREATKWLVFRYGCGYDLTSYIRRHYLKRTSFTINMGNPYRLPSEYEMERYRAFIGLFANIEVVKYVDKDIRKRFKFTEFNDKRNISLKNSMMAENSVAVHLRKGKDYLVNEAFSGTCSVDYYRKAIDYIYRNVKNPVFYVFTDNPEWLKENMKGFDYNLIDWNPAIGRGNHYDLQLMSCCKHNIISNSTYSWWAAYLNNNANKIVIEPKVWYNPQVRDDLNLNNGLLCQDWIAI